MTFRKAAKWSLGFGAALLLLTGGAWLAWLGVANLELRMAERDIRQAGLPASFYTLLPPAIPEGENAAPLLIRIEGLVKALKATNGFVVSCPGSGAEKTDPTRFNEARLAELRRQMEWPEVQEILRLWNQAAAKPAAAFPRDYDAGPAMELKGTTGQLDASRLVGTSAWLKASDGDPTGAVADLVACSRAASFDMNDPLLISWLVGVAVDQLSVHMAQEALAALPESAFRAEEWQDLREQWAQNASNARGNLARALDGERTGFGDWIFKKVLQNGYSLGDLVADQLQAISPKSGDVRPFFLAYQYPLRPLLVADRTAYLRFMLRMRERAENFSPGEPDENPRDGIPKTAILTRLAAGGMEGSLPRLGEYLVQMQLAQLGLSLESFRAKTGSYPNSLEALPLPPGATTDPFTGKPFAYKADADNVLVYSFGKDRADDSGNSKWNNSRRDVVWQVKRAGADKPSPQ